MATTETRSRELVRAAARWEQQRREENRGKAKADKTRSMTDLSSEELAQAAKSGFVPVRAAA